MPQALTVQCTACDATLALSRQLGVAAVEIATFFDCHNEHDRYGITILREPPDRAIDLRDESPVLLARHA